MAGLDRTGKTQSDIRASKLRQILNFSAEPELEKEQDLQPEALEAGSQTLPISAVHVSASQPRRYFDPDKIEELAASIKEHGILENLLVRPLAGKAGQYELIAGERRYRAAQQIGLEDVPVTIRDLTDQQALEVALVENLQREDLNPVEETEGILQLLSVRLEMSVEEVPPLLYKMQNESKGHITQNVLGNEEGKAVIQVFQALGLISWESFVTSRLPLLNLPQDVLEVLRQGKIAYTKAQAIARVPDQTQRSQVLHEAITQNLSLSQIKEKITRFNEATKSQEIASPSLKSQIDDVLRLAKRSKVWNNPKKQRRLEKLLQEFRALVSDESTSKD